MDCRKIGCRKTRTCSKVLGGVKRRKENIWAFGRRGQGVVWLAENPGKKKDEVAVLEMPRYDFGNMSTGLDQI